MKLWIRTLLLFLLTLPVFPLLLVYAAFQRKLKGTVMERCLFGDWRVLHRGKAQRVWVHAASVGEFLGVLPLLKRLESELTRHQVVMTATSKAGKAEMRKHLPRHLSLLLPVDFLPLMLGAFFKVRPGLLLIAETEIWPTMLILAHLTKTPVVFVNARISDYAFSGYQRMQWLLRPVLAQVTLICAQSETDRARFLALGALADNVIVTGSTKYDSGQAEVDTGALSRLALEIGIEDSRPCFVAGSVRMGEEDVVLSAFLALREKIPGVQMIFAPRQVELFDAMFEKVRHRLDGATINLQRRSAGACKGNVDVIFLDTIGELSRCYAFADVAFVGGGFIPGIGGHNPLEPAMHAVPVTFGPEMNNFRDAVAALVAEGAGVTVANAEELQNCLLRWFADRSFAVQAGERAQGIWRNNLGATEIVSNELRERGLCVLSSSGVSNRGCQ
ncbi:MAG: glycosyltransferase N-terminal domain-containing protein [bacterium]|nr:glycosyltransferase N-terminal domain-containing protein [bacterium]